MLELVEGVGKKRAGWETCCDKGVTIGQVRMLLHLILARRLRSDVALLLKALNCSRG